jgi:hypothetical protein
MLRLPFSTTATAPAQSRIGSWLRRADIPGASAAIERALAAAVPDVPPQQRFSMPGHASRVGRWVSTTADCLVAPRAQGVRIG